MAYSSDYKIKLFEEDCKHLINAITGFKEEEENFLQCLDFTLSNLVYHSFLDVNSHKVNCFISGLHEKFFIQSDLQKARSFKLVTDKLLETFSSKNCSQKETAYTVLMLLLYLSESKLYSKFVTKSCDDAVEHNIKNRESENDAKDAINWASCLREDDKEYILSDSSSEIFSSEDDDLLDVMYAPEYHFPMVPRDDSGLGVSPDSCSSQHPFGSMAITLYQEEIDLAVARSSDENDKIGRRKGEKSVFYPYWILKYQQSITPNSYNLMTMNFTRIWEEHVAVLDCLPPTGMKKVIIHERNVIKEILWMLNGVKDLYLFQWNSYGFIVNPVIHLANLTSQTSLGYALKDFCHYGAKHVFLNNFIEEALFEDPYGTDFCLTFHAYAAAIWKQLQKINDAFCQLEKSLMIRKETFTILHIFAKCKSVLYDLDTLYYLNHDVLEAIPMNCGPMEKACRLLHILWQHIYNLSLRDQTSSSIKIILTIFLESCKPFFAFLESLTIHGNFRDIHEEFICSRNSNIKVTDEAFWEHGLMLKNLPHDIQENFFFKSFLNDIVLAGKSNEILSKINSLMKTEPFRLHVKKGELYSKFVLILYKISHNKLPEKTSHPANQPLVNEDMLLLRNPLMRQNIFRYNSCLEKFFCPEINPVYVPIAKTPAEKLFTEIQLYTEKAIELMNLKSLKPLNGSVLKAFGKCMMYAYYPTCRKLMRVLKTQYDLIAHIKIMQKYFLMESGDKMFSFYSEVFEKIFYNKPWQDVSFLYSVLQNAISEDKENCKSLYIFLDTSNTDIQISQPLSQLNALQLFYKVEWPVSIMLGNNVQKQYCQIFSFLLQIKAAKYLLDELHFSSLYDKQPQSLLANLVSRAEFPRQQKVHGLYLLRMRLMYFVNGLHNYIMARILHSFGLEFNAILEDAQTVDEMLVSHTTYLNSLHEKCFLDKHLGPHLRDRMLMVLNLCHSLQQMWLKGVDQISLEELESVELQFSKYCNFLFSYFNTPLRRGIYIHLENLVSLMLSETHGFHVFNWKRRFSHQPVTECIKSNSTPYSELY